MRRNSAGVLGPLFTVFLVGFGHSSTLVAIVGLSGIAAIVLWLFVSS